MAFLLLPSGHPNTLPGPPTPHSSPTSPQWVIHFHDPAVHCSTIIAQGGKSSQLLPQIPRLHTLPWGYFLIPTSPRVYLNNTIWHQWSASLSQICFSDIISNLVLELVSWLISYSHQVAFCSSHCTIWLLWASQSFISEHPPLLTSLYSPWILIFLTCSPLQLILYWGSRVFLQVLEYLLILGPIYIFKHYFLVDSCPSTHISTSL